MKIYIVSEATISPQNNDISNWDLTSEKAAQNLFTCIEPDFSQFLDARATRRMSRMMKMGLTAALMCLKQAKIETPNAILTSTGYGCLEDTAAFLAKLSHEDGQVLNPTPFIQSTHNTVSGAIALHLKCKSYNNTFTQSGFSFESALSEAFLLFNEKSDLNILLGSMDEKIEPANQIINQIHQLRHSNKKMLAMGEGFSFFMLSNFNSHNALSLDFFKTLYKPSNVELNSTYEEMSESAGSPDLILVGTNNSEINDNHYQWINSTNKGAPLLCYKKYCGEYPTAPAFAHWLACNILRYGHSGLNNPNKILIYNQSEGKNHSFTLLSK